MKKSVFIAALSTFLAYGAVVEARTSSDAEMRGYNNCVKAAKQESEGLVTSREYLINKERGIYEYYVNATRWEQGERNTIRVACETAQRGAKLISASIEEGRFVPEETRVTIDVAAN
ncbi:MAG: hypothetical protein NXH95_07450 [Pseudomonadaceae bacterium]|nr:hypothetical protein [Pseudomonadaceae bacterium]